MTFCPRLSWKRGTLKLIRPYVSPSVCQSLCHKNFNLAHIFWSINDRALIFGMHDPCDKPFLLIPCGDIDLDLWPTSRSNLLPGGGPQFFEFACWGKIFRSKGICNLRIPLTIPMQLQAWLTGKRFFSSVTGVVNLTYASVAVVCVGIRIRSDRSVMVDMSEGVDIGVILACCGGMQGIGRSQQWWSFNSVWGTVIFSSWALLLVLIEL